MLTYLTLIVYHAYSHSLCKIVIQLLTANVCCGLLLLTFFKFSCGNSEKYVDETEK